MFFRRRRFYLNQYYDKAIYYDRKTHEVLEAPKSKLLDTEKSNKMKSTYSSLSCSLYS